MRVCLALLLFLQVLCFALAEHCAFKPAKDPSCPSFSCCVSLQALGHNAYEIRLTHRLQKNWQGKQARGLKTTWLPVSNFFGFVRRIASRTSHNPCSARILFSGKPSELFALQLQTSELPIAQWNEFMGTLSRSVVYWTGPSSYSPTGNYLNVTSASPGTIVTNDASCSEFNEVLNYARQAFFPPQAVLVMALSAFVVICFAIWMCFFFADPVSPETSRVAFVDVGYGSLENGFDFNSPLQGSDGYGHGVTHGGGKHDEGAGEGGAHGGFIGSVAGVAAGHAHSAGVGGGHDGGYGH